VFGLPPDDLYGLVGQPLAFPQQPQTTQVLFSWTFGDGTTSNSNAPIKTYAAPGAYVASVVVTRLSDGATRTYSVNVYVAGQPALYTGFLNEIITAAAQPANNLWSYEWFLSSQSVSYTAGANPTFASTLIGTQNTLALNISSYVPAGIGLYSLTLRATLGQDPYTVANFSSTVAVAGLPTRLYGHVNNIAFTNNFPLWINSTFPQPRHSNLSYTWTITQGSGGTIGGGAT
jgi:hypothetical protein